jgi:hypothetical protein
LWSKSTAKFAEALVGQIVLKYLSAIVGWEAPDVTQDTTEDLQDTPNVLQQTPDDLRETPDDLQETPDDQQENVNDIIQKRRGQILQLSLA